MHTTQPNLIPSVNSFSHPLMINLSTSSSNSKITLISSPLLPFNSRNMPIKRKSLHISKDFKIESFNLLPISNKMIDMQKPISKSPFYGFSIRSAATKKSSVSIKTLKKPLSRFSRISLTLMISQPSSN